MNRRLTLFLILLVVSVYANTLLGDFVAGDREFIVRNPAVGEFQTVMKSFFSDYWKALGGGSFVYYRPLIILTHFIDYNLYGLTPAGHHLSNLIFHALVTILFFRLLLCLFPARHWVAFGGAALFALHPIHTHSVSYVMGRTDVLAAVFYLCGFIVLVRMPLTAGKVLLACLFYWLALLCKEIAVTLPVAFILHRFFWEPGPGQQKKSAIIIPILCLGGTFILYFLMRSYVLDTSTPEGILPTGYTPWQHLLLVITTGGFYLWKLVLPVRLSYYSNISMPVQFTETVTEPLFLAAVLFCIVCLVCLKKLPRLGFALAWTGCSLLPVINIIPLPSLAKENYLYIPSMGFCLLFSIAVVHTAGKWRTMIWCLIVLIAFWYGVGTIKRNTDFSDPVLFLQRTRDAMDPIPIHQRNNVLYLEGVKNFYTLYKNLGRLYMEREQWSEAAEAFEEALQYSTPFPPDYSAHLKVSLGTLYEKTGELEKAARVLSDALPLTGRPHYVANLLGVIAARQHKTQKAENYFKQAIASKEDYAPAYFNLGKLYMKHGSNQEGAAALREAARLYPKYLPFLSRGRK